MRQMLLLYSKHHENSKHINYTTNTPLIQLTQLPLQLLHRLLWRICGIRVTCIVMNVCNTIMTTMTPMTPNRITTGFRMVVMTHITTTPAATPPLNTPRHAYLPRSPDSRINSSIASSESLSYGIVNPRSSRPAIRSIVRTSSKHASRRPSAR